MAINQAQSSTSIQNRSYNNPDRDAALKMLVSGVQSGLDNSSKAALAGQEAGLKDAAQKKDLERIKGMGLKPGDAAKVGDTMVSKTGEGRREQMLLSQQLSAQRHMNDTYNKSLNKMQDEQQAIAEGMEALQHPNSLTAGQLRTNMIRANGMNRYNQDEGGQLFNKTMQEKYANFMNGLGDNKTTITPEQAKAAQQFYQDHLNSLTQRHDIVKRNAQSQFPSQFGQAPAIGGAFDDQLKQMNDKYFSPQGKQGTADAQSPNGVTQPAAPGGIMDKLKNWLGGGGGQQQQAPAQTMRVRHKATGQTGTISPNEFDPQVYDKIGQ